MGHWAAVVPAGRYDRERLYASSEVHVGAGAAAPGDLVALIADVEPPVLFGLGTVAGSGGAVAYRRRLFDAPIELDRRWPAGLSALTEAEYTALAARVGAAPPPVSRWLVSVSAPIEATSAAEAVREFWSYVEALGPDELPAFVSPDGDELATKAYVNGAETDLDPEDD